ncbi:S-layer homology domain-containing protein [Nakamurella silvestris]|nr:S-layer homology domain-containing protein [Nakamurella silvestris]
MTSTRMWRWISTITLVVGVALSSGMTAGVAAAASPPDPGGPCACGKPFPDVAKNSEFCEAIQWAKDEGIVLGNADGKFHGADLMDRQAIAAILYRYETGKTTGKCTTGTSGYSDIPTSNQFCNAIRWAKDSGLLKGNGDGTFGPTVPVTRAAIAVLLYRSVSILQLPGIPLVGCLIGIFPNITFFSGFSDVTITTPRCAEIKFMKDFNLSQGWAKAGSLPEYRPNLAVERQAIIAFIYRFDQVFITT